MIKCQPIEIDETNPFKNDALNRKENIEILSSFILSFEQPIVLCIDAPWGQGKTTFLKMWKQDLTNQNIPTIYFNAWENDFTDDALVSLIGEIGSSIETLSNKENNNIQVAFDKVKKYGAIIAKKSIPAAIKIASAGIIDDKDISSAISSVGESIAKEQIEKYEKSKKSLNEFKKSLAELATSFTLSDNKKPLVFIIDELDRCRPNFAIEVLEKAKHLFNVNNVIFVLAIDKTQLGHSIKAIYGQDLDVNGYLRRFIDFDYLLPQPNIKGAFIKYLFRKYNLNSIIRRDDFEVLESAFIEMLIIYNLTLREQETFFSILNLVIRTNKCPEKQEYIILCFLITLKIKYPDIYKNLTNKYDLSSIEIVLEQINTLFRPANSKVYESGWLESFLIYSKFYDVFRNNESSVFSEINIYATKYSLSPEKKERINSQLTRLINNNYNDEIILYELKKSIEISSNFIEN